MRYVATRVSGPAEEPITRGEAKLHLKIESGQTDDDELIDALVSADREACEEFTNRCLVWSNWELRLDEFPTDLDGEIRLPRPPLRQVLAVRYVDADGAKQLLGSGNYLVDDRSEPARVRPAYGLQWPATRQQMGAVTVEYVAGYPIDDAGSPTDWSAGVPKPIIAALKLQLGHLYRNREAVNIGNIVTELDLAVRWLLWQHRVTDYLISA